MCDYVGTGGVMIAMDTAESLTARVATQYESLVRRR